MNKYDIRFRTSKGENDELIVEATDTKEAIKKCRANNLNKIYIFSVERRH